MTPARLQVGPIVGQLVDPVLPLFGRNQHPVPHVAQKLDFHDMDLFHRDPRDVGPSLVSVGVVVQELVAEHESHG